MKYTKIRDLVIEVLEPSIDIIKRTRKRKSMPFKDIESILKIFFHKTKHFETGKGFFKNVFVIHSNKKKLVLKIGRRKNHIRKDYNTYIKLPKTTRNRYFARIYWIHNLFMLQKYGKKVKVPKNEKEKLQAIGKKHALIDVKDANIMKFGNNFKIVDAERKK